MKLNNKDLQTNFELRRSPLTFGITFMFVPFALGYLTFTLIGTFSPIYRMVFESKEMTGSILTDILGTIGFIIFWNLLITGFFSLSWFKGFRNFPNQIIKNENEIKLIYKIKWLNKTIPIKECKIEIVNFLGVQKLVINRNYKVFAYKFQTNFFY